MTRSSAELAEETRRELLAGAQHLASRVQRLARLRGVAWWGFIVLAAMLLLVAADVILRREEIGLRLLSLALWVGVIAWAGWRFVQPAWKLYPTPVQLARWIERSRPDLEDRLSTAVQLAEVNANDERFGSRAFRDAVLRSWQAETQKPNWSAYVDGTRVGRTLLLLMALLAGGVVVAMLRPIESRLALQRFFTPWSAPAWPRRDQLEFVSLPEIAALGSELQLEIIDRNSPLPDNVAVRVRNVNEGLGRESEIPAKVIDEVAIANLPPLDRAIEVRAVGGDDIHMPWHRIDVVSPPKLKQYQFSIEPPAYSDRSPIELIGTRIQVLSGSNVVFTGQLDQAVRNATVKRLDEEDATQQAQASSELSLSEQSLVATLAGSPATSLAIAAADGRPLELTKTVSWRLEVETLEGLRIELPQRWTIDVVADAPPTAVMLPPGLPALTESGQVKVVGNASDDLGLESVSVVAALDGASDEAVSQVLWSGEGDKRQDVSVASEWDVAAAFEQAGQTLVPGQVLTVWLEARDQLGQLGRSQVERLEIQSSDKVIATLVERQSQLLDQLREMIMVQQRNLGITDRTEKQLRGSESISQADVDALNGVAQSQRSLAEQLSGQQESLLSQVDELQTLLKSNRLEDVALAGQLGDLERQLEGIASERMPSALDSAGSAHQAAADLLQGESGDTAETLERLVDSSLAQAGVLEEMQGLANELNRSGSIQQLQQELSALAGKQDLLRAETEALQLAQLRGTRSEAVENARNTIIAEQDALAEQLDGILERARELASDQTDEADSLVEGLRRAAGILNDQQASQVMHQAADDLAARELTSAIAAQSKVTEALAKAMQQLSSSAGDSRAGDLSQQAEQLRARRDAVTELAGAQQSLAERMHSTPAGDSQQFAEEQQALAEATERQAELAGQQGDSAAAEPLKSIGQSQAEASRAAEQADMQTAASAAEQAAQELRQLAKELQDRAQQVSRESQRQQMYQLQAVVKRLVDEQQPLVDEVTGLAQDFEDAAVEPSLQQRARDFAADQEKVRQALEDLRKEVGELTAFQWTLAQTDADMAKAIAAAERFRIAPDALSSAEDALRKLELTLDAFESANNGQPRADAQDPQGEAGENGVGEEQNSSNAFPPLASLKLLRGLQRELNAQTQQLDGEPDAARRNRRQRELAEQQEALGVQLEALLRDMANR